MKKEDIDRIKAKLEELKKSLEDMKMEYQNLEYDVRRSMPSVKVTMYIYLRGNLEKDLREVGLSEAFNIMMDNIDCIISVLDDKKLDYKELVKLIQTLTDEINQISVYKSIALKINDLLKDIIVTFNLAESKLKGTIKNDILDRIISLRDTLLKELAYTSDIRNFEMNSLPKYHEILRDLREAIEEFAMRPIHEISKQETTSSERRATVHQPIVSDSLFDEIISKIDEAAAKTLEIWLKNEYDNAIKRGRKEISLREFNDDQISTILKIAEEQGLKVKYKPLTKSLVITDEEE